MSLSVGEFQRLADEVSTLTKSPTCCDVQFEVALSVRTKSGVDLAAANKVIEKIKAGWKLS